VSLVVILNTLEAIDAHEGLSALVYFVTVFLESHALSSHKLDPVINFKLLNIFVDLKHIGVDIPIQGKGVFIILENGWECLDLIWQADIHVFRGSLSKIINKIFQLIVTLVLHA